MADAPRRSLPSMGAPGVYIHEVSGGSHPIVAVGTSTAGFVGTAPKHEDKTIAPADLKAVSIDNWAAFQREFFTGNWTHLAHAVYGFFLNGGSRCYVVDIGQDNSQLQAGLDLLKEIDEVAIVAAPGYTTDADYGLIRDHCLLMGDRVGILDVPESLTSATDLSQFSPPSVSRTDRGHTTMYAPWLKVANPVDPRSEPVSVPPSGHIAGVWARTDVERGVHKAPANEVVSGALDLTAKINDQTHAEMNRRGINAIRYFRDSGYLVWGARTLANDSEWRYVNVRRLCNMIEESIAESTRWVVFEPNDESLWASIRRDVGAFLTDQWRQGALFGNTPEEAFFVKCDAENNPFDSIRLGRVIIDVGLAPVLPAEFLIFRISQYEAGTDVETA